jgi:hypothetical protein
VPLSDLTTVRLTCKQNNCGGVAEMPTERLADNTFFKCPLCGADLRRSTKMNTADDPLSLLARAIKEVGSMGNQLDVEFVIPDGTG